MMFREWLDNATDRNDEVGEFARYTQENIPHAADTTDYAGIRRACAENAVTDDTWEALEIADKEFNQGDESRELFMENWNSEDQS